MADKRPAAPRGTTPAPGTGSGRADIAAFITRAQGLAPAPAPAAKSGAGGGRLIFALDATMSRQPTWDAACSLQAEMFRATDAAGGLSVQLAYFRGIDEARASRWVRDADGLARLMTGLACRGGLTQIGRMLDHAAREAKKTPVAAFVYVGDAMEENIDALCAKAGALGLRRTRAFMFLEGRDPAAERAFREIARLTGGVMLPFNRSAAGELRALLAAVATYAAGGRAALEAAGTDAAARLLAALRP